MSLHEGEDIVRAPGSRTVMWTETTRFYLYEAPEDLELTEEAIEEYLQTHDASYFEHTGITDIKERRVTVEDPPKAGPRCSGG